MIDALTYEYFIRRCHQVGRFGNKAADADSFRALERLHIDSKAVSSSNSKDIEKVKLEFDKQLKAIISFAEKALDKALSSFKQIETSDRNALGELKQQLEHADFQELQRIIGEADRILLKYGIYPA